MKISSIVARVVFITVGFAVFVQAQERAEPMLVVTGIVSGSTAENVGIKAGDVIIAYDGKKIHGHAELSALVKSTDKDSAEITIMRDEKTLALTIPSGFIGVYLKEVLPDIVFDDDAVMIEGIEPLTWESGELNSFVGALTRIAEYLHIPRDYSYLMGASGAAFRIQFHKAWCPSSPDITVGKDCGILAAQSINLDYRYVRVEEGKKDDPEVRAAIMEAIDKGMPVIAIDLVNIPEWGIITGYQKRGKELIVRTYFDRRRGYEIAEKFPWVVLLIAGEKTNVDDHSNFKNALSLAQEMYETEKYDDYYSGIAALEYWIEKLKSNDFAQYDDKKISEVIVANAWIYERLADDRKCGAYYLRSHAGHFPDVATQLMAIAQLYEEIHDIMINAGKNVPYPDYLETRNDWTREMRQEEIEALTQVLAKEKQVFTLIKEINSKLQQ